LFATNPALSAPVKLSTRSNFLQPFERRRGGGVV